MWDRTGSPSRVVIGVDFSPPSMAAARWASGVVFPRSEVILAHALVIPELGGVLGGRYPIADSLMENARSGAMRRLRDARTALGLPDAVLEVREGRPSEAIAEIIREHDADVVVIGKHGEGGQHRGYSGRTADQLVRSSPASVLVANGMMREHPETIVVPLTYSSITPHIIEWTRRISAATEARVIVLHVIGSAVLSHVLSMANIRRDETLTADQIDEIFKDDSDRWKDELIAAGIPSSRITSEVVFGEVSSSVLGAARDHGADMIIMGSHAGPLRRMLLGSAATAVLRDADIPVFVVVEPDKAAPVRAAREFAGAVTGDQNAVYTI